MNETYDPAKSREKGLDAGATATVGGAIVTVVQVGVALSQGGTLTEAAAAGLVSAIVTLGAAGAAGLRAWWRNRKKHKRDKESPPSDTGVNYGALVVVLGALSLLMAGCAAIQSADGTWTVQTDTNTLDRYWDRYEAMERRKTDLERECKVASPDRVAAIARELEALEPQLRDLAGVLGVKRPK